MRVLTTLLVVFTAFVSVSTALGASDPLEKRSTAVTTYPPQSRPIMFQLRERIQIRERLFSHGARFNMRQIWRRRAALFTFAEECIASALISTYQGTNEPATAPSKVIREKPRRLTDQPWSFPAPTMACFSSRTVSTSSLMVFRFRIIGRRILDRFRWGLWLRELVTTFKS